MSTQPRNDLSRRTSGLDGKSNFQVVADSPKLEQVVIADAETAAGSVQTPTDAPVVSVGDILEIDHHLLPFAQPDPAAKSDREKAKDA